MIFESLKTIPNCVILMSDKVPIHENIILTVILVGVLMASIDSTIVLLAFPDITSALHSNLSTIIWVILIYMLVSAVATTQFGRVGDIYGRSRIFNAGLAVFTVASLLCGLAPTDTLLIAFRAVQGLGSAMVSATSGAIIADTFERHRIGRAYGFTAMGWNVGAILGIVLGGFITTFIGYRYIFFINVPIGIIALLLGVRYLKDNSTLKEKLDLTGMLTLVIAISSLLYGGVVLASSGPNAFDIGLIIAGFVFGAIFYFAEKRSKSPTIKFDMFSNTVFRNSIFASFLQGLGFLGVTFMLIMYLQGVRGFSPFYASLLLIPGYVASGFLSPFMGRVSDKHGARVIATAGIAVQILGVLIYLTLGTLSSIYMVMAGSLVVGLGGAMFWPSNSSAVMAHAEQKRFGTASGLLRLFSSMGMMGSFIIVMVVSSLSIPRSMAFQVFAGTSKIIGGVASSFVAGMHVSFIAMIIMLLIAGIISFARGKENRAVPASVAST